MATVMAITRMHAFTTNAILFVSFPVSPTLRPQRIRTYNPVSLRRCQLCLQQEDPCPSEPRFMRERSRCVKA